MHVEEENFWARSLGKWRKTGVECGTNHATSCGEESIVIIRARSGRERLDEYPVVYERGF
jgi:hypothetical protein